jgi:hypothetical protein
MANPSKKIREQRNDLSPFLFHYTKAFEDLLSIIDQKKLKSKKKYICFTEAPLSTSLRMFDYMNQYPDPMYAPYGIGFNRDFLFNIGARPVIYGTEDENKKIPHELKWRCLNLQPESYDFSWLREWRIEGNEFDFKDYCNNIIIVAPTNKELKKLTTDYDVDVDFAYEHEIRMSIPELIYIPKREFRGISLEKIRNDSYLSDSEVSNDVGSQTLSEPLDD